MADPSKASAAGLQAVSPEGPLYRIARGPDPWAWPNWANVGSDATFGNRWDDPQGVYRVLYASSSRLGALVEVLARFRPDPHVLEALNEIEGEDDTAVQLPGELDAGWLRHRRLGVAQVEGEFVDVGHSASLARLRDALASRIVHHGLDDLDAAAIRLSAPRRFTQEISRYVYDRSTPQGRRRFDGIAYLSRLGDEFRNWALFESPGSALPWVGEPETLAIEAHDPDLVRALERLGVRLMAR
ncbi:MAG: RES family NAD+ phosphorylase [Myxococcota bacterium]|nr:RES family NAD+ phosphorylase [Myxococcota bacterium]